MQFDLRHASFDDWLTFIFDHPAIPESDRGKTGIREWYWLLHSDEIGVDSGRQIACIRQLFEQSSVLLGRYTPAQVDQGLWCMFGGWGRDLFVGQFWNPEVPWPERAAAIRALTQLYDDLLGTHDVGTAGFMLWDLLAYDYYSGNRKPGENTEDLRVQQVMFETLEQMLQADSARTQMAALHGLHHLMHPQGLTAVQRFLLERRPGIEVAEYAHHVLARTAL